MQCAPGGRHAPCSKTADPEYITGSDRHLGHVSQWVLFAVFALGAAVTVAEEASCFIRLEYRLLFENETLLY
jgi:hypothetical protein